VIGNPFNGFGVDTILSKTIKSGMYSPTFTVL
jgi:hypothetical protein